MDDEPTGFVPFRIDLRVCPQMVGAKTAFQFGAGPVYVSPAMFALLRDATPTELEFLLRTIPVMVLPPQADTFTHVPLDAIQSVDWSNL